MKKALFLLRILILLAMFLGLQQPIHAAKRAEQKHVQGAQSIDTHQLAQVIAKVAQGGWEFIGNASFLFNPNPDFIIGAAAPQLMTDGTVIVFERDFPVSGKVWKLTPDIFGKYENGTWSEITSLPVIGSRRYTPLYFPSAVLADGRLIIAGGEYQGPDVDFIFTPPGSEGANYVAIYDPFSNTWSSVAPPPFFGNLYPPRAAITPSVIGDAASVVLEDGTWMVQDKMTTQAALLDLKTLTWAETGTGSKAPRWNDEENLTLLPNGKVLTVNCYTESLFCPCPPPNPPVCTNCYPYPSDPTGSQIYDPKTGIWRSAGSTINTLTSPDSGEIGISVLRPDGTVFCSGVDGDNNSIYDSKAGTWSVAPRLPLFPILTGFLDITAPPPVAGSYEPPLVTLPAGGANDSPFSLTGNIVPTNPPNANGGPYDPLPPGSIALITASAQDVIDFGFFIDLDSAQAAMEAGAIGVIFDDRNTASAGFGPGGPYVIPVLWLDQTLGDQSVDNSVGLNGTMSSSCRDTKLGTGDNTGVLLPNGNVLFSATKETDQAGGSPITFFEFNGTEYSLEPLPFALFGARFGINLVGLPTGQVLSTDSAYGDINIYTPSDQTYDPAWAPRISHFEDKVNPGKTYRIDGFLFNGMSQAADGSDDVQAPTNYPLVRITNKETGHVFYCRTHNHSFMGVAATNKCVHTFFDVPTSWAGYPMEYGPSTIQVIANGIPSEAKDITVSHPSPKLLRYPKKIRPGKSYRIEFDWLPEGGQYSDVFVRITNDKTGHTVDCKVYEYSKDCKYTCTRFDVPKHIDCGRSHLKVVANGNSSKSKEVYVK